MNNCSNFFIVQKKKYEHKYKDLSGKKTNGSTRKGIQQVSKKSSDMPGEVLAKRIRCCSPSSPSSISRLSSMLLPLCNGNGGNPGSKSWLASWPHLPYLGHSISQLIRLHSYRISSRKSGVLLTIYISLWATTTTSTSSCMPIAANKIALLHYTQAYIHDGFGTNFCTTAILLRVPSGSYEFKPSAPG
jgi:hypothetical protein